MNIEIRRERFKKKHEQFSKDIHNLRDLRAWWRITEAEYKKEMQKIRRAARKLDDANPDLAAEALEVRRSHGFPG